MLYEKITPEIKSLKLDYGHEQLADVLRQLGYCWTNISQPGDLCVSLWNKELGQRLWISFQQSLKNEEETSMYFTLERVDINCETLMPPFLYLGGNLDQLLDASAEDEVVSRVVA